MPDATGLELIAQEIRQRHPEAILDTVFFREEATIEIAPADARDVLIALREQGYGFLASLHGVDYYPDEPRLSVHWQLLDMTTVDRICVKTRMPVEEAHVASVVDLWPGANHPEREVYDMFGVVFDGHPDMRRILMPEDYEGHPQRRDFPVGGEPVIFTYNEDKIPGWTR
ncbi:NADH-quinone oxidoreductase subunit C [Conexibacter sp. JD483]|uniref:NADH-quinone oxidoreductase subunit C n=1 Tax=unclassified Conexibacter TaxID=2627773 RepID=UPI0027229502|nr:MULTISPECIES: NADH-quinone oxidoreductase subunit C [unclassified Conexibacter]MDO8187408.1 NADH-quinone oxidoreductase subunit C [Conexibacter sp. CPCC 205706]MDO8201003.1 NADH-quinone oxidoreductase subunit C [Conexibacter sp. CPCC 205762]MDR9370318.1 NADH-quinone oxidoreductase subunit C [Conexibacter sp. JD483]